MELNETVEMMNSEDYRERFRAEYLQLRIRTLGLKDMLHSYKHGTLTFTPSCSYELLRAQLSSMEAYAGILEERARIEHIKL